ncbi:MAG TPA: 6-carboxytetrahydropterin synthase [Ignavibacteria bacterium]|nr:6-carboxytetrahydropterin synthase [Ignavibacteria bacterium]HMR00070.1 6-carboxytetrahydropterin synthase [Ignavibacteria bacterium]
MFYITRKFHFSASHRVYDPMLSDEDNLKKYGKCSNPNGHGHNYEMDVTVAGEIDPAIGYVMDLTELKLLVEKIIIEKVDHKNLNLDVDFMSGVLPSTENIALSFWNQLEGKINSNGRKLYSIKVKETVNNSVEYKGNN